MTETAEELISDLRQSVASLDARVKELDTLDSTSPDYALRARSTAELITQALLKVDSVQISKDAAADALRNGERGKSRKLAVLLARRKTAVKKLNQLGDAVDTLLTKNPGSELSETPVDTPADASAEALADSAAEVSNEAEE